MGARRSEQKDRKTRSLGAASGGIAGGETKQAVAAVQDLKACSEVPRNEMCPGKKDPCAGSPHFDVRRVDTTEVATEPSLP